MRYAIPVYACILALGVALGAFGAHGLKGRVSPELVAVWDTATLYHLVHALAALGLSLVGLVVGWLNLWVSDTSSESALRHSVQVARFPRVLERTAVILSCGTLLFSGSLYLYVLTGSKTFALITPLGGVFFIAGWLYLAVASFLTARK